MIKYNCYIYIKKECKYLKEIEDIVGIENIKYFEPMCNHTSFKIGGLADIFISINNLDKLQKLLKYCRESNILITIIR